MDTPSICLLAANSIALSNVSFFAGQSRGLLEEPGSPKAEGFTIESILDSPWFHCESTW